MKATGGPSKKRHGKHPLITACIVVGGVVLGLGGLWLGLVLGGSRGPTAAQTVSTVFAGSTTGTAPQSIESAKTSRRFARFAVESGGHNVGSAVIVSLPNPGATTLAGRLLRAPEDLGLCIVLDTSGVIRAADVIDRGSTVPGVSALRRSVATWTGLSIFELARGDTVAVPQGGAMTSDVMVDLGRTLVSVDYGNAVLVRCEAATAVDPVALRAGDFVPTIETADVTGRRVNLASILGHTSLLMNCDPFCGTCFDMTVGLFARIVEQGKAPETMLVLMQASADSDRGRLLLASLPKGVTVIEDPDNIVAHSMGMNVSAYAVVTDSSGKVTWSRRIAIETNISEAIRRVENANLGGS